MNVQQSGQQTEASQLQPITILPVGGASSESAAVTTGSDKKQKLYKLGILFVHGVGRQPAGETLVKWSDILLKTIRRATNNEVKPHVVEATINSESGNRPQAIVEFHGGEKWLIADGWWAGVFPAPSYAELVSWSVRALPWSICLHFAERYWSIAHEPTSWRKILRISSTVFQLLGGLALSPVFVGVLLLTLLLAWLPISQLRALLLNVQSVLSETIGDSLAMIESPFRAALIRTQIRDGIRHISLPCEHMIIIGHSQGAAVVLDALGGIAEPFENEQPDTISMNCNLPEVDTLVTFGAGTNKLVSLKVLASDLFEKDSAANATYLALAALFGAAGTVIYMGHQSYINRLPASSIAYAAMLFLASTALAVATGWGIKHLIRRVVAAFALNNPTKAASIATVSITTSFLLATAIYIYFGRSNPAFGPFNGFIVALGMLAASIIVMLSKSLKDTVTAPVKKPRGLKRWIDISASADLVSNGMTRVRDGGHEYHEIFNEGSFISDHTSYWRNAEGFVLKVARVCAETAESHWAKQLVPDEPMSVARARWRVELLALARISTIATWAVVLSLVCLRGEAPLAIKTPDWVAPQFAGLLQLLVLIFGVLVLTWLHLTVQRCVWRFWVNSEQKEALARRRPDSGAFFVMVLLFAIPIVIPLFMLQLHSGSGSIQLGNVWDMVKETCILAFGFAAIPAALCSLMKRPPRLPKSNGD